MSQYSRKQNPIGPDLILIWDSENSDWRLTSFNNTVSLYETILPSLQNAMQKPVSQYLSPTVPFTLTLSGSNDIHLILTPTVVIATGTIALPASTETADKQTVLISSSQEITALTIDGNGATLIGAPTTIGIGGFFTMKYDVLSNVWNRVG